MDKYIFKDLVHQNSKGRVYNAFSLERYCHCIIKQSNENAKEASVLIELTHPYIVRAYEYDAENNYLVLEQLTGLTLKALLEERLELNQIVLIGMQLASAISYLHVRGIIHVDIKPSNIIIDAGRVKLIDFHLAQYGPGKVSRGHGTRLYQAPEQKAGYVEYATDVWQIGRVLELMLDKTTAATEQLQSLHSLVAWCKKVDPAHRPSAEDVFITLADY